MENKKYGILQGAEKKRQTFLHVLNLDSYDLRGWERALPPKWLYILFPFYQSNSYLQAISSTA